jgi:phage-related holin
MGYFITFCFIVMDYLTGILKALYTGTFSSKIMRQGLFHKTALLLIMALGFMVDYAQKYVDLGATIPVGGALCAYIILMEIGSSLENLCQTNPELMPDKLCCVFGSIVSLGDEEQTEMDAESNLITTEGTVEKDENQ